MEMLVKYWFLIIALLAVVYFVAYGIFQFIKWPKETKVKNIKEWLKWAVIQAEKKLGGGTGQLKLRMVYNMAVEKFPFIVDFITFEQFSVWVDEALDWMREQLEKNENIQALVNGGEKDESTDNL